MSAGFEERTVNITKVPMAFAKGGILLKAARWNNEQILSAGIEITDEVIEEYQDVALYIPLSLRAMPTPSATVELVKKNIVAYRSQQKHEKVRDISQSYGPGDVIFQQGDTEDKDCYFLVEGSVDVLIGNNKVATIFEPGQPIGEMSFLSDDPRSATIRAAEPAKLLRIRKQDEKNLMRTNPTIVQTLLSALVKRLKQTSQNLSEAKSRVSELESVEAEVTVLRSELETAKAGAGPLQTQVEGLEQDRRTLAQHAEKELGIRRGDALVFEQVLKAAETAGAPPQLLTLLQAYLAYLQVRGLSKVAKPIFEVENMAEALKALFRQAGK